ncbi:MAG: serine/threonine protein kinase [Planctomycetota bacterium]|nr:MAG: serine/threonine protein kinase [Planctomycetota bacterium]
MNWWENFSSQEYQVSEKLGEGSMGVVLKATSLSTKMPVAIKLVLPEIAKDKSFVQRFLREMQAVMALDHKNIVKAIDCGVDLENDMYFVVLEFIEGESLKEKISKNGTLPLQTALQITKGVAEGLQSAYEKSFIHRDIKPDNILITKEGVPKITDFGLTKTASSGELEGPQVAAGLTLKGSILGTPFYLAPEQAMGETDVDIRADIYALGITLYHMLAGRPPYLYKSAMRIIHAHCFEPLPPIQEFAPHLPPSITEILEKMTAKQREQRYSTPKEVAQAIERVLPQISPSSPSSSPDLTSDEEFHESPTVVSSTTPPPHKPTQNPSKITEAFSSKELLLQGIICPIQSLSTLEACQYLVSEKCTGILKISPPNHAQHQILFLSGNIVHATSPQAKGTQAFFENVKIQEGELHFIPQKEISNVEIIEDTDTLLQKAKNLP